MYTEGDNFCAFFDLYDDFAVIDSATSPTHITLYQIKGHKSAAFDCTALSKKQGTTPQTIVGKMYHHTTIFGDDLDRAVLLTNAELKFVLAEGGKSDEGHMLISAKDLDVSELSKIAAALQLDFPSPRSPDEKEILAFERTSVPLDGYEAYLKGRLLETVNEATTTAISGLYRTLVLEVTSRSNEMTESASLEEMIRHKGLSRDEIKLALETAEQRVDVLSHLALIEEELKTSGRKSGECIRVTSSMIKHLNALSKRASEIAVLSTSIQQVISQLGQALSPADSLVSNAERVMQNLNANITAQMDDHEILGACICEVFHAHYA